jgi:membrane-bound serine protease (ClpP class)
MRFSRFRLLLWFGLLLGISLTAAARTGATKNARKGPRTERTGDGIDGTGGEIALPIGIPMPFVEPTPSGGGGTEGGTNPDQPAHIVYQFNLDDEIGAPAWRQTRSAFQQARAMNASCVLIHMNTFGGALDAADNIRQCVLDYDRPVYVFVDHNAASAGALISLACDSIYMSKGASMGAATVVDQQGNLAPEKYQSYMRSLLRSTAQANNRDPRIAEAMNDSRIVIPGVNESGRVLTFTTLEAIQNNYCEAQAENVAEILARNGMSNYQVIQHQATFIDSAISFLMHPLVSGILIVLIIAGIWFELQSPGIGFPLILALTSALLFFAPHYLDGLAQHWEIVVFLVGVGLLTLELVAIPGFGVVGISGILLMITGLTLTMIGSNPDGSEFALPTMEQFGKALALVVVSVLVAFVGAFWLGEKLFGTRLFGKMVLQTEQGSTNGFISSDLAAQTAELYGKQGFATTLLRPSGKVEIDGEQYDATAETGFIEKGETVEIVSIGVAQVVVRKKAA